MKNTIRNTNLQTIVLIKPLATNLSEIVFRNAYIFIQENPILQVVCKMAAILSRPLNNAPCAMELITITNPGMRLFHIPQCPIQNRSVDISVLNRAFWDTEQVHSEICEICLL